MSKCVDRERAHVERKDGEKGSEGKSVSPEGRHEGCTAHVRTESEK